MTIDAKTRARYQARAKILKALAHPTRVLIVEQLAEGERCVCELQAMIDADISTVSKHLAQLKSAGLVEDEKRGTMVFYRLRMPCFIRFMQCIDAVMKRNAADQIALVE